MLTFSFLSSFLGIFVLIFFSVFVGSVIYLIKYIIDQKKIAEERKIFYQNNNKVFRDGYMVDADEEEK